MIENKTNRTLCYDHVLEGMCSEGSNLQCALINIKEGSYLQEYSYEYIKKLANHVFLYTNPKIVDIILYDLYSLIFDGKAIINPLKDYDDELMGFEVGLHSDDIKIKRENGTTGALYEAYKSRRKLKSGEYEYTNTFYGAMNINYKDVRKTFKLGENSLNVLVNNSSYSYEIDVTVDKNNNLNYVISRIDGKTKEVIFSADEFNIREFIEINQTRTDDNIINNILPEISQKDFYKRVRK